MITKDTLDNMSEYEKNCAVADKLGHVIDYAHRGPNPQYNDVLWHEGETNRSADYCNEPRDYMWIAIEYGITISQDIENQEVSCIAYQKDLISGENVIMSRIYPNNETGEAVVDAFLMMDALK